MNTWRVYLSFSLKGTQKLFHILSEVDEPKLSNAAIVFPPSFLLNGSNSSDTWHCCYTWNKNFQHDTLQEMTNTFKHLNKDNSECNNHEDDVEFITDCVHQLANEIPSTGISLLEIYVFLGDEVYNDERGGGVGIYIKNDTKHKIRKYITKINPALWVEIEGKNKHSKLLLNVAYQPNFTNQEKADWLESFDRIVGTAILDWTGNVVITGDFNIDLLSNSQIKDSYLETLRSFDLTQHVKSPSRKGVSLIDYISTNSSCKVKFCEVLPTPEISDHDAVFACLNTRVALFEPRLHMDLFLALKRLELWNNALMMLIEEDGNDGSTRSWTDLFNFEVITHEMFHKHHTLTPLWGGAVTLLMEKRSSHLPIGKWYLQATQESTKDGKDRKDEFFKNILGKRLTNGIAFGNNIEIAACVQQEDLPYHLMYPVKYTLHSLNEKTGFDFFKFCSKIKGCWCMAFLRYDFSKQTITPERTREEWMQHIQESLSHYLCVDYSWSRLRHHCVMFVRYSELNNQDKTSTESSCILDVYFLRHRPFFNANGYLELLKKCDDGLENSLADEKLEASNQYTSQAVELIHPSEWCEKQAWYLRENASNVGK
ncbi:uncharacterized protein [Clytia hemisphaerica]|uniref:uncharacterized protein n=1 Tax=Clytia hemisphaerica TaxID=252671 RepID=UPI0034D6710B